MKAVYLDDWLVHQQADWTVVQLVVPRAGKKVEHLAVLMAAKLDERRAERLDVLTAEY